MHKRGNHGAAFWKQAVEHENSARRNFEAYTGDHS